MSNSFYAIRQISTGWFLPAQFKTASHRKLGRKAFTWSEPQADCVPRLFAKKQYATQALNWWLEGQFSYRTTGGVHEPPDTWLANIKQPYRRKDDMEIVEVFVVVAPPVDFAPEIPEPEPEPEPLLEAESIEMPAILSTCKGCSYLRLCKNQLCEECEDYIQEGKYEY